ncbi:MAG: ABC transporter permease [Bryobacteraceae bacterium]
MDSFTQLKYVLRRLLRTPMFTAITLLTLAVGIGANTAIFSVINGILLKPLPYLNSDRLVAIWHSAPGVNLDEVNNGPSNYFTYREENKTFESIGLWQNDTESITGIAEPEEVRAIMMTDGVLESLGVRPLLGRAFTPADVVTDSPRVTILSYGYWQRRFAGDRSILGKRILTDGRPREIIGVMPEDFRFLTQSPALYIPLQFNRAKVFLGNFSYQGIARMKPGITLAQANADVGRMLPLTLSKFPPPPGMSTKIFEEARFAPRLRTLKQDVIGDIGSVLWVLMGTIGIVLLIACANVANLLLVRAEGRQQELAVRAALGAGRQQIAKELLLESMTLGVLGGVLGLGVAYGSIRLLLRLAPSTLPRLEDIGIDGSVLAFTIGVSLVAGVLFGLIPVFKYASGQVATVLRGGSRTVSQSKDRHRAQGILVVAQFALALVLLISAGLMIRTFTGLRSVNPGFRYDNMQTLRIGIPTAQVPEPLRVMRMENDIQEKLASLPGVTAVAVGNSMPLDGNNSNDPVYAEDRQYAEGTLPAIRRYKYVGPDYFKALGIPLVAGRELTWQDIYQKTPMVIVSESLARDLWKEPGAAIGKRIRENPGGVFREIIGVVGNVRDDGVDHPAAVTAYWPLLIEKFWADPMQVSRSITYAIRSERAGSEAFLKEVREAIWSVNPNLPLANVRTLESVYQRSMGRTSFALVMLAIAGGMALLLGVVGIYGVLSYAVSQRTREIGIRMALGAQREQLHGMFLKRGLILAGVGIVCGLAVAAVASRLMSSMLYSISPLDPLTYGAVAATLVVAALAASYLPARRATSIDPVEALRSE